MVRTCSAEETVTDHQRCNPIETAALTLWRGVLDNDTDNLSVVNDDGTSLESGATKEIMSVKDESGSGTESTSVITD